jgi:hypothetical protein
MKKPLSKLERDPLRDAWKHEANDFTPWVELKMSDSYKKSPDESTRAFCRPSIPSPNAF